MLRTVLPRPEICGRAVLQTQPSRVYTAGQWGRYHHWNRRNQCGDLPFLCRSDKEGGCIRPDALYRCCCWSCTLSWVLLWYRWHRQQLPVLETSPYRKRFHWILNLLGSCLASEPWQALGKRLPSWSPFHSEMVRWRHLAIRYSVAHCPWYRQQSYCRRFSVDQGNRAYCRRADHVPPSRHCKIPDRKSLWPHLWCVCRNACVWDRTRQTMVYLLWRHHLWIFLPPSRFRHQCFSYVLLSMGRYRRFSVCRFCPTSDRPWDHLYPWPSYVSHPVGQTSRETWDLWDNRDSPAPPRHWGGISYQRTHRTHGWSAGIYSSHPDGFFRIVRLCSRVIWGFEPE